MDPEDAVGPVRGRHRDRDAACDTAVAQQRLRAEALLPGEIGHDDGLVRDERVAGLGVRARVHGRPADEPVRPTRARDEQQLLPAGKELEHLGAIDCEHVDEELAGLRHQAAEPVAAERAAAEPGERIRLEKAPLELLVEAGLAHRDGQVAGQLRRGLELGPVRQAGGVFVDERQDSHHLAAGN